MVVKKVVEMNVRGVTRTVSLGNVTTNGSRIARMYVGGKTVTGRVFTNKLGVLRFVPTGANSYLV